MAYPFAVLLDDDALATWQAEAVRILETSGRAHLRCILWVPSPPKDQKSAGACEQAYASFVRRQGIPHLQPVAARDVFAGRGWIDYRRLQIGRAPLTAPGAEAAARMDLDFILALTRREVPEEILGAARHGVWKFIYGDLAVFEAAVPAFWEVLYGHEVTSAALLRLLPAPNLGVVLKQAYLATQRTSFADNAVLLTQEMQTWPSLACRDLEAGAAAYANDPPTLGPKQRFGVPAARDVWVLRARTWRQSIAHAWRRRFLRQDWTIALADRGPADFVDADARPGVRLLAAYDRSRFLADCFLAGRDGRTYVFFEDFDYRRARGVISVAPLDGSLPLQTRVALEEPHHLSYPQVFEHRGTVYCLPESVYARVVRLYRALEFPYRWEPAATLLENFAAVDPTLVFFDGRWWMFCTNLDEGYHSHLYIWYAADLFGPWRGHAANPVKVDVRSAGPAGPLFVHEGVLYRPAQDCSRVYGGCIRLNRIERLTTHDFKETPAGTIRPPRGAYSQGLHTIAARDGVAVVDVMRYVVNPRGIVGLARGWAGAVARGVGVPDESLDALRARLRAWRRPQVRRL